jgi:hypothetical protein
MRAARTIRRRFARGKSLDTRSVRPLSSIPKRPCRSIPSGVHRNPVSAPLAASSTNIQARLLPPMEMRLALPSHRPPNEFQRPHSPVFYIISHIRFRSTLIRRIPAYHPLRSTLAPLRPSEMLSTAADLPNRISLKMKRETNESTSPTSPAKDPQVSHRHH